jgi:hypothetical protein
MAAAARHQAAVLSDSSQRPASGRLVFFSAAIAVLAVVLSTVLGAIPSSVQTAPAARNGIGASHPGMIFTVGVSQPVSPGEPRCESTPQPQIAAGACVAAEDAGEDAGSHVLRHYTTQDAADAIAKDGTINPGVNSGKIWVTPDEYADGFEAQARLALNKTPEGYFEFPASRVLEPSPPSIVEPYYGQPGGGTEITTENPIDVGDLSFILFGE